MKMKMDSSKRQPGQHTLRIGSVLLSDDSQGLTTHGCTLGDPGEKNGPVGHIGNPPRAFNFFLKILKFVRITPIL